MAESPTSTYFELSAAHTAELSVDLGQVKTGTEIEYFSTHTLLRIMFLKIKFCLLTLSMLGALETF